MTPISLVIITFNEENNIAACIASALDLVDEVFVLDSFSTDKTREIAETLGAKVHTNIFDGHIQQKNRAKDLAKNKWVLSLDADERLSDELRKSISNLKLENEITGYTMNRLNHYCGKPIKTCGWYPDQKLRLWNKEKGNWGGVNPHDRFELSEGKTEHLSGNILHFTYPDKATMWAQANKFAAIAAEQNKNKNAVYLLAKMIFSSSFKFIKTYLIQLGFTDGKYGWDICRNQAREVFMKYRLALKLK